MRQRKLGERLRALILATPLIAIPACSTGNCGPLSPQTEVLPIADLSPDGGSDCHTACFAACINCFDGRQFNECSFVDSGYGPAVSCTSTLLCPGGRRPASLLPASGAQASHLTGRYFAETAGLEAASIPAFKILAGELIAHRAPDQLIRASYRSAADEVRHARGMASLARRYGVEPTIPRLGVQPQDRSLEEVATENAVEGCVRETYGVLVALWQARYAQDPAVAGAMGPIAADETRHAELAWEVASWAEPRLPRAARTRIDTARTDALIDLMTEAARPVPASLVSLAGLPSPEIATALLRGLAADVVHPVV
jgi:hypothetical protein